MVPLGNQKKYSLNCIGLDKGNSHGSVALLHQSDYIVLHTSMARDQLQIISMKSMG